MRRIARFSIALLLAAALAPATLLASGSVSSGTLDNEAYAQIRWVKGEILSVGPAPGYEVQIRLEDKRELAFVLPDGLKLKSADKAAFSGRKKLRPEDLAAGQAIRLSYQEQPFRLLEIKVLKGADPVAREAAKTDAEAGSR